MKNTAENLEKKYLESNGNYCPFCGCDDIEAGHFETDGNTAWRPVECNGCNKEWNEEYALAGAIFNSDDLSD
jgi:formate dehydrogenase maturation protein FdhE